ncbi:MAG: hypothetical protein C4533_00525 [Candidatus Omnitrophota bacterium]|jgi:hypothetical protein|nr:MAG: hypothetical protein C4533_00525 [Candidatus Omnitrophota bacterium]
MKKTILFAVAFAVFFTGISYAESLLIDDFEGVISGGAQGTVDFGSGNGSSLNVSASTGTKYSGNQSLELKYDAISGGYMWAARGSSLDAAGAGWLIKPEDIEWGGYSKISFYMFGSNSGAMVAFDIKDSGSEIWRFLIEDNFTGWKQIVCEFNKFMARDDWQPQDADNNLELDFPLKSFQFEVLPEAKGTVYFDKVELE